MPSAIWSSVATQPKPQAVSITVKEARRVSGLLQVPQKKSEGGLDGRQ
jgi:hypothetical protein